MTARLGKLTCVVALLFAACSSSESNPGGGSGGLSCDDVCVSIVNAQCPNGPATREQCVTGCEDFRSRCQPQFQALYACSGQDPSFVCDAQGFITVSRCEAEYNELTACASQR